MKILAIRNETCLGPSVWSVPDFKEGLRALNMEVLGIEAGAMHVI